MARPDAAIVDGPVRQRPCTRRQVQPPSQGAKLFAQSDRARIACRYAEHGAARDRARPGRPEAWTRSHVAHPCSAHWVQWKALPQHDAGPTEMDVQLLSRLLACRAFQTLVFWRHMQAVRRCMHLQFHLRQTVVNLFQIGTVPQCVCVCVCVCNTD
jgi:hypothetical protein